MTGNRAMTSSYWPGLRPVAVGVDGSAAALEAVRWAAAEAECRGVPLRLGYAISRQSGPWDRAGLGVAARRVLDRAVAAATTAVPGVHVGTSTLQANPVDALVLLTTTAAEVVVLGAGGLPAEVATRAACPIVVVRGERTAELVRSGATVVLGADERADADSPVVRFAFETAARHKAPLHVVRTLAARPLASARFPDVEVVDDLVAGPPEQALVAAAREAQLLVVGGRARGGQTGLVLGPVTRAVLRDAGCPVAVVPIHG
ncbi:universal stress protein [Fodinicola acaciae]|uniref:universal stress protein n=1 Tax=Fodinicola acaciae TaxID=2681555 RepID=UPI0013CFBC4C|nr:universal stress protein [Fodinicola acaciae]